MPSADTTEEILNLLKLADQLTAKGDSASLVLAIETLDRAIALLTSRPRHCDPKSDWLLGIGWLKRGNALRDQHEPKNESEALASYDKAITIMEGIQSLSVGSMVQWRQQELDLLHDDLANAWTNRGIALLAQRSASSLKESVRAFDLAIDLRRTLPLTTNHSFSYGLAATWMNRGDALARLGSAHDLERGVRSYDEAISIMSSLPINENDSFRCRLAVAWMNRGITLQSQGTRESVTEAVKSFDQAILLFGKAPDVPHKDAIVHLACAWINRANALLLASSSYDALKARESAKQALSMVDDLEEEELLPAEIGLKARHVLCRAIGALLSGRSVPLENEKLILETSDSVDDAMKLARKWTARGVESLHPLSLEIFHYGALFYMSYQPQFLAEFLLENLDPFRSPDAIPGCAKMQAIAAEAFSRAHDILTHRMFNDQDIERKKEWVRILRELQVSQKRISEVTAGRILT